MTRGIFPVLILLALSATIACTAVQQQKAVAAAPDSAGFHNLQVLPANLTHDELIGVMRGFTGALGTKCEHCHVHIQGGGERDFDFPSDAKPEKKVARTMLRMTRMINADYISRVNAHGQTVACMTCHRGKSIPDATPPVAPPREQAPQPAPPAPTPR